MNIFVGILKRIGKSEHFADFLLDSMWRLLVDGALIDPKFRSDLVWEIAFPDTLFDGFVLF